MVHRLFWVLLLVLVTFSAVPVILWGFPCEEGDTDDIDSTTITDVSRQDTGNGPAFYNFVRVDCRTCTHVNCSDAFNVLISIWGTPTTSFDCVFSYYPGHIKSTLMYFHHCSNYKLERTNQLCRDSHCETIQATCTLVTPKPRPAQDAGSLPLPPGDSSGDCFHKDTRIKYKGALWTMSDLIQGKEAECAIPHVVLSYEAVRIFSSCANTALQVTPSHLIKVGNKFQEAQQLKAGQILAGTNAKTGETCFVTMVERITTRMPQQYFGLNCLESEVIASGIHASTFGDLHYLPAIFMRVVGNLVGIKTASSIGDKFASIYHMMYGQMMRQFSQQAHVSN